MGCSLRLSCSGFVWALCRFSPCSSPSPRSTWAGPHSPCWRASGPWPWRRIRGRQASGLCGRTTALATWTKACRQRWERSSLLLPGQLLLQVSARRLSSRAADRKTDSISHHAGSDPARLTSPQACRKPGAPSPVREKASRFQKVGRPPEAEPHPSRWTCVSHRLHAPTDPGEGGRERASREPSPPPLTQVTC